jgi:enediyne biosynthesis protein E4
VDGDGDVDILVNNSGGPAMLLRNELPPGRHWLTVRLRGAGKNRFGIGARVSVTARGRTQIAEVRAGNSYASTSDPRLHFGLGAAAKAERIVVRWPGGGVSALRSVTVDREVVVSEARTRHP